MTRNHILICLTVVSMLSGLGLYSQEYSGFLSMVKNLESKYQVKISYDANLLSEKNDFAGKENYQSTDIRATLEQLLANHSITYKIIDGNKVLLRKEPSSNGLSIISGQIWDDSTNEPLPFASIYVPGTTIGTISDLNGNFSLNTDNAETLVVQFLGYEEATIDCKNFKGKISLTPKAIPIDEVTIFIHPKTMNDPGSDHIIYDANRWIEKSSSEVFGKDLIRSLQLLPGIAADNDEGGKIRIRGSESDEVLMLIDGIPLYKMEHYYGIFGAINPFYVDNLALYKNNQPLEYETRTGGLLVLNSQKDIEKVNGQVEADLMKINGNVNIPVGDIGISMGGRWNHTDPFQTILADNADNVDLENAYIDRESFRRAEIAEAIPVYNFHDLNGKIYWNINDKNHIQLSGISVRDQYQRDYANQFRLLINRRLTQNDEGFKEFEKWKNDGFSLEFNHQLDQSTKIVGRIYNAYYENYNQVDAKIFLRNNNEVLIDRSYQSTNENKLTTNGLDLVLEKDDAFSIGLKFISRNNQLRLSENQNKLIQRNQDVQEYSAFVSKILFIGSCTKIDFGGKFNYIESIKQASFSPSIGITSRINNHLNLKTSYARLYQNIRELQMETRLGLNQQYFVIADNEVYPQGIAHNYMVGLGWSDKLWGVDIEAYYKHLDGAIGYLPVKPGIITSGFLPDVSSLFRVFSGEMNSRGLDFLVYLDHRKWYSQLAYTLSKSENVFSEIYRGNAFPSQYDRRHQLKWLNNYKITEDLTIGKTLIYSSGRPYLAFDKIQDVSDRNNSEVQDAIQNLPDYFRLDLSVSYKFKTGTIRPYLSASVYNVTNSENVKYIQQTFRIRSDAKRNNVVLGFESPLLERLYNLSFGISF